MGLGQAAVPLLVLVAGLTPQGSSAPAPTAVVVDVHPTSRSQIIRNPNVLVSVQRRQGADLAWDADCAGIPFQDSLSAATCTSALANGLCGGPISLACSRTCSNCTTRLSNGARDDDHGGGDETAASCHDLLPDWIDSNGDACSTYENRDWLVCCCCHPCSVSYGSERQGRLFF